LAIQAFARQRAIDFISAVFAAVGPQGMDKAVRRLRSVAFPEEGQSDIEYLKKAAAMFKKLRGLRVKIKTV
jgi:hypothetical protein